MKKYLILIFPILLASCFWPSKNEIQTAKNEMNNPTSINTKNENSSWTEISNESPKTEIIKEKSYFKVNHLTSENFIDVNEVENIENIKEKLDIKWIVNNPDIEKIKISFTNPTSKFPSDEYNLKTFKKWNKDFLYRAYKSYSVLDLWLNTYTIEWFVWENMVSKVEVVVFIADNSKTWTGNIVETSSWSMQTSTFSWEIFEKLPTDEQTYWTPSINEDTFSYSNLKDFNWFKNSELSNVNCENFADYLKENYTWYYWNTCRPTSGENNFSVNVLSLSWDEYKYEKHYISANLWVYMKVLLDSWTWVMQSDLQTKNDELKAKAFDTTNSDKLFKDLLK